MLKYRTVQLWLLQGVAALQSGDQRASQHLSFAVADLLPPLH